MFGTTRDQLTADLANFARVFDNGCKVVASNTDQEVSTFQLGVANIDDFEGRVFASNAAGVMSKINPRIDIDTTSQSRTNSSTAVRMTQDYRFVILSSHCNKSPCLHNDRGIS